MIGMVDMVNSMFFYIYQNKPMIPYEIGNYG